MNQLTQTTDLFPQRKEQLHTTNSKANNLLGKIATRYMAFRRENQRRASRAYDPDEMSDTDFEYYHVPKSNEVSVEFNGKQEVLPVLNPDEAQRKITVIYDERAAVDQHIPVQGSSENADDRRE